MLQQWPGEANAAFAERKQLWSVGVATVLLEQILFFWSGDTFKRRLLDLQIKNVVRAYSSCTEVWFCRVAAIDRGVSLLPHARTGSAPTRFGDSKSTFSTCFCDSGSLAEQTALASAAKESSVWPCMCWCLGYSSKSTSIPLLQWWKLHGFFEMFMSGYFHGPKYGGTSVEAFFAESCHSLPCWNNGQAELASIQMPLSVGKISWV